MAEINWGLARTPDFAGNAYAARSQGQADRRQRDTQNAYALYAQDPDAGAQAIMAIDPQTGIALQDRQTALAATKRKQGYAAQAAGGDIAGASTEAMKAGDFDFLESLGKLDDRKKAEVRRQNEIGASVALGLQSLKTPQERAAQIQALAPKLKADGFNDAQIAAIPTDDAGIVSALALSQSVKDILAQKNADRTFDAGRADATFSQGMEKQKFGETVRSNRVGESQRAQQIGIASQAEARQGSAAAIAARGRPIPAPIVTGYQGNNSTIAKIDATIAAIKARPNALGLDRALGEGINQRIDPGGIEARAGVSDIGSQKIHDRSGAAVTASETPRLKPFIPTVTDTPAAAIKKLTRMKQEYLSNNAQIEAQYAPESGYQALRAAQPVAQAGDAGGGTVLRFDARGNRIK